MLEKRSIRLLPFLMLCAILAGCGSTANDTLQYWNQVKSVVDDPASGRDAAAALRALPTARVDPDAVKVARAAASALDAVSGQPDEEQADQAAPPKTPQSAADKLAALQTLSIDAQQKLSAKYQLEFPPL
jgi:hypothetical protein